MSCWRENQSSPGKARVSRKKKLRKLGMKVLSGKLTVDEARARLGRTVSQKSAGPAFITKSAAPNESAAPYEAFRRLMLTPVDPPAKSLTPSELGVLAQMEHEVRTTTSPAEREHARATMVKLRGY
jgi:hypothetical protein